MNQSATSKSFVSAGDILYYKFGISIKQMEEKGARGLVPAVCKSMLLLSFEKTDEMPVERVMSATAVST